MADDADADDCPLCLEPLPPPSWRGTERHRLVCCGKLTCASCDAAMTNHSSRLIDEMQSTDNRAQVLETFRQLQQMAKCPLCRTEAPPSDRELFKLVKSRVEQHDWPWAHYKLGMYYKTGRGTPVDRTSAFHHFDKAAQGGNVTAQHEVGNCYQYGTGVTKSIKDAIQWYEKGADANLAISQYALGHIFQEQGKFEAAAKMFLDAAEQGFDKSQAALAHCYERGNGVERSLQKSLYWNKLAADQGEATAMANYAQNLLLECSMANGGQVDKLGNSCLPQAVFWLRKSVAAGFSTAGPVLRQLETGCWSQCGKCAQRNVPLSKCVRCKAVVYCSRDCQRMHWKAGHKRDCVDDNGKKLSRPTP